MNHARQLYLASYGVIDTIDQAIKSSRLFYCSWKYWHSSMLHGKAMVWAIAYSLYEECAEGMINLDWKVTDKVDFWTFRDVGADQLLGYNQTKRKFIRDKMMRISSQQNTKQRTKMLRSLCRKNTINRVVHVTRDQFHDEKVGKRLTSSRLCGNLEGLNEHIASVVKIPNPIICEVCGKIFTASVVCVTKDFISLFKEEKMYQTMNFVSHVIMMIYFMVQQGQIHT